MKDTINTAIELLKSNSKIRDWILSEIKVKEYQHYHTINNETENYASGNSSNANITIFVDNGKNEIGSASFTLLVSSKEEIKQKIEDAILSAKLIKNKSYELPDSKNQKYIKINKHDDFISENNSEFFEKHMYEIANQAQLMVKNKPGFKLNSLEIRAIDSQKKIQTSKNVNASEKGTRVYIEMIITAKKGDVEMEHFVFTENRKMLDLDINDLVEKGCSMVSDVLNSKKPIEFKGPIILSDDANVEFWTPNQSANTLLIHSSAKMKYLGLSKFEIGKEITENVLGDKINMISDPTIDFAIGSTSFDEEGCASKKLTIIENGILKNFLATKKYADYLKINPTGPLGNIVIPLSTHKEKDLLAGDFYEIVNFSSFVPNSISGDFSAEIRLGYMHKNGKKIPFKGGMFLGNVFELIKNVKFSNKELQKGFYIGPSITRFELGHVSGD